MTKQFGKVPIQMRQWVRHVIDVPADSGWAFEFDGMWVFAPNNGISPHTCPHRNNYFPRPNR